MSGNVLIDSKEEALKRILEQAPYFDPQKRLSRRLRRDYDLNLMMAETLPTYLYHCHRSFQDDEKIVAIAINKFGGGFFQVASKRVRSIPTLAYRAVLTYPHALLHLPTHLKNNRFLVKVAVRQNGELLRKLNSKWKDDVETVMDAVNETGFAYAHASKRLQGNISIIAAAIARSPMAFRLVSKTNQDRISPGIEDVAMTVSGFLLKHFDEESDYDTVLKTIKLNGLALKYATERFRSNVSIVLHATRRCSDAFFFASGEAKLDRYLEKLARELSCLRNRLPRLCTFLLKRYRDQKDADAKMKVDLWLIKNGLVDWISAKK